MSSSLATESPRRHFRTNGEWEDRSPIRHRATTSLSGVTSFGSFWVLTPPVASAGQPGFTTLSGGFKPCKDVALRMTRERYFELVEGVHRMANPGPKIRRTLLEAYADVVDALRRAGIRFVLYGAFAMAAYGYERATKDVDFLVPVRPNAVRTVYAVMDELGGVPARPGPRTADEALRKGARHISFNLAGWLIDFFFDADFDAILSRAVRRRFGNRVIDVISVRDLAERKAERGSLQDLADIEKLGSAE